MTPAVSAISTIVGDRASLRTPSSAGGNRLRSEILLRARAGRDLRDIERALIEPAAIEVDEKAALWLLAWSAQELGGSRCPN